MNTADEVTAKLLNFSAEDWARHRLNDAIEMFKERPRSDEWLYLQRCMLVYQQAKLYSERHRLSEKLRGQPPSTWDDIIVRTCTGNCLASFMQEFAK